jgi:hypothetical protein
MVFALLGEGGLGFIGFLFWLWMIYECATREPNSTEKVLWLLLVIFAPVIGSLVSCAW